MIGIVVALKKEAEFLLKIGNNLNKICKDNRELFTFSIDQKEAVLIISGIGKVNAAMATQYLIDKFSPTKILNFGTAGGVGNVNVLDVYAIEKCCQVDFDVREIDNVSLGYIQDFDTVCFPALTDNLGFLPKANLATADRFCSEDSFILDVLSLNCNIRDMEGCAIAQTCLKNHVSFFCIKGVTDVHNSNNSAEQFLQNLEIVSKKLAEVIYKVICVI